MDIFTVIQVFGKALDLLGVVIMIVGIILATGHFLGGWMSHEVLEKIYRAYRRNLGRVIILGLEFLVAGDIIRSVAGTPTFQSVGILAAIVLIRSFLSMEFEMEVEGHLPWQKNKKEN